MTAPSARHHRTEGGAERQLDVRSRPAAPFAEADLPLEDEDDVGREVTVPPHHHARVVARVDGQVLGIGREGQPLLPHGDTNRPVALRLDRLPGHLGIVEVSEGGARSILGDGGVGVGSGTSGEVTPLDASPMFRRAIWTNAGGT